MTTEEVNKYRNIGYLINKVISLHARFERGTITKDENRLLDTLLTLTPLFLTENEICVNGWGSKQNKGKK